MEKKNSHIPAKAFLKKAARQTWSTAFLVTLLFGGIALAVSSFSGPPAGCTPTSCPTNPLKIDFTNGYVQAKKLLLSDVVTEGTACTPNGLVARDSGGAILSCQSGIWTGSYKKPGTDLAFSVSLVSPQISSSGGWGETHLTSARTDASGNLWFTGYDYSCCSYATTSWGDTLVVYRSNLQNGTTISYHNLSGLYVKLNGSILNIKVNTASGNIDQNFTGNPV